MQADRPIVLSVAGFDPCGGAGVLADVKTFEQLQVQGMAIITANTIQTENRFAQMEWQPLEMILKSLETLMQCYKIDVVKIGIVKDTAFLKAIIDKIRQQNKKTFIIWDTVFKSSSGFTFFEGRNLSSLLEIIAAVDLITPNYEEYQILKKTVNSSEINAVFIKGGHRKEALGIDILKQNNQEITFPPTGINVFPKHGSGCVLSSAIAAHIALGKSPEAACRAGKRYVEYFLNSHPSLLGYHHYV